MSEAAAADGFSSGAAVMRVLSDDRLARRAVKGDERAFETIFQRYHQRLYRFCLAIVGDPQDAQDALQNTMVKVMGALPGEERRIELKPWLYRIAHNESVDLLRRRRDTRQLDPELAAPGSGLAEETAVRERLRRLISDLDELPERQRETLVMRELAGLDFAEIGAALGTSAAVARQTLYESRLSLRQMEEGREMDCEAVTKALSDRDRRVTRRRDVRAHLRSCANCRRFGEEIDARQRDLAALSPLPAVAATGLLHGLLGGHATAGGGLAGALGGGAAKSIGLSAALKGAATVAVVAAIGVTAADRGGAIDLGLPRGGGSEATRTQPAAGTESADSTVTGGAAERSATGASGGARVGSSQAKKTATGKVASPQDGKANSVVATPAQTPPGAAHPHGRGHQKEPPNASAHGQQTAAHKAADHGGGGSRGSVGHKSKPVHPSKPSPAKGPRSSPPSGGGKGAHGDATAQAAVPSEDAAPAPEAGQTP